MLLVKKIHPNAILPTKAHDGDLGYDLYALDNEVIKHGEITLVRTGIACQFPIGYGALLRDRSSVATKYGAAIVAGVIDNGYTGEILVAMHQIGKLNYHISKGQKIAQMILIPTVNFQVFEVDEIVSADTRAEKGFGSSGTT
jgi:deoxyuridine 5'-triphosphate nucleotidohydrolase